MSKKIIFRAGLAAIAVVVAVLYLLSVVVPDTFKWFNLSVAIAVFSGLAGVLYVLKGMLSKNVGIMKKLNILIGAALLIVCIIACVSAALLPKNLVLPIIAIVITAGLLLTILVVGGKKWDEGDNKKVGYKNYYDRKKEEEKDNKDNN